LTRILSGSSPTIRENNNRATELGEGPGARTTIRVCHRDTVTENAQLARSWSALWTQRRYGEHFTVRPLQAIEWSLPAVSNNSAKVLARNHVMLFAKTLVSHSFRSQQVTCFSLFVRRTGAQ